MTELFRKYDVPAPRYTSYPTVPYWNKTPKVEEWIQHLRQTLQSDQSSWGLYLHVPFCETLCTFCGCNTSLTKDHRREMPYVELLLKELKLYLEKVPELTKSKCKQIHLGGGSPTFLSAASLKHLLCEIQNHIEVDRAHFEGSIEVDPRRTTVDQLKTVFNLNIKRVSMGVQDFDPEVQRLVNRHQPFEMTKKLTEECRRIGFESVNFDLIYGLAKQTPESFSKTADLTIELMPDRIALYSFALVPWIKPAQRLFKDEDLPKAEEKRLLYEIAREKLIKAGYVEVGMDHFALPHDGLNQAMVNRVLHRNFMGYTDVRTDVLLGIGVSSISETPFSFHQNEKVLAEYEDKISSGILPTLRGHILDGEDQKRRRQILKFMTEFSVELEEDQTHFAEIFLKEMITDGLVEVQSKKLNMTQKGKPFLRNACLFFDEHLRRSQPHTKIFSQSI